MAQSQEAHLPKMTFEGLSTTENMTAHRVADFLDRLSMRICRDTFVVLDNASVHKCKLMRELRPIWERRGHFIFFLPPYSPHLNIAETPTRLTFVCTPNRALAMILY